MGACYYYRAAVDWAVLMYMYYYEHRPIFISYTYRSEIILLVNGAEPTLLDAKRALGSPTHHCKSSRNFRRILRG